MAKFCVKCGAQLEDDGVCKVCGTAAVRVFIKEGDIYAMKTQEVEKAASFVLKTYTSPPAMEYFDISNMNDYELIPSR